MPFRHEPRGLRRDLVMADSPADGQRIVDLNLGEDAWISLVIRDGHLIPVQGSTSLRAGDGDWCGRSSPRRFFGRRSGGPKVTQARGRVPSGLGLCGEAGGRDAVVLPSQVEE